MMPLSLSNVSGIDVSNKTEIKCVQKPKIYGISKDAIL